MYGVRYVQCALSIFILAVLGLVGAGYSLDQAFFLTTRYGGSFFAGLYGSLLAYRSVFSPLNRFPGPWSAKFSTLSLSAQVWRGDAHTRILRLHQQFGDFVRVGSSDLSIIHPQAVSAIYGRGSPCMKAAWYEMAAPLVSMQSTRNRQEHDARRRIWAPAFTDTMVRSYEERLATYQDQLIEHILDLGSRPVDVSHLFDLYSYDVMGDLGSGTSFNMLKSDQHHSTIEQYRKAIISLSWNLPVWVLRLLLAVSGPTGKDWFPGVTYSCERRDERMKIKPASRDIMSFLLDPWVDRTLSSSDMNMLHGDSQLIIVAGSDTTSATLVCALHELTKFPNGIPQLRTEIESLLQSGKTISNQNLHSLAFLNGVINETLRLYPPAGMLQRLTPPEGLDIGGTHIPGNTTVFCPFYALGRSGSSFYHWRTQ
ncbi:MAG: hypothetical protein L6R37_004880 [Teloschistes peruensis]|nr:MAG: hypothetical protein L6R37_004880 [Teloschistes peruensis]